MATQHEDKVTELLLKEMFWNVRLGVIAITPAIALYYVLLIFDSGLAPHIPWGSATAVWIVVLNIYFFLGENWVKNLRHRTLTANTVLTLAVGTIGTAFLFQIPFIRDQSILITAYALMIGVLGAAAFVFSCNKFTYILFAIGWTLPLDFWLVAFAPDLGKKVLGLMFLVYIGAMIFLSRKDYNRRVSLIEVGLNLEDEKEEVVKAHDVILESTKKLEAALQTVTTLKKQQDGDYYLTSLLIQPLSINTAEANREVRINFYSEQKKKFEFKNRTFQIGGDMNIAHTILLKGVECSVIMNADAMGKSIQGAGGALVLGAVFQSIMDRTRAKKEYQDLYPERWIKEAFIQLQKVFESFNGSMLVSIILCVIENKNGSLYCINAEHPQAVLLRGNKAEFLPFEKQYRKLGTPDLNDKITVNTFTLRKDDVLILGSDGRDDIHLPGEESGNRIINEDEELFLRSAEKAGGDLEKIRNEIAAHGELVDDLTMIRISYHGVLAEPAKLTAAERESILDIRRGKNTSEQRELLLHAIQRLETDSPSLEFRKRLAFLAFNLREFAIAIRQATVYTSSFPLDNETIFLLAAANKNLHLFSEAIDFAERLRLRDPKNLKYVSLLIDAYIQTRNEIIARKLVNEARQIDPNHEKLMRWETALSA